MSHRSLLLALLLSGLAVAPPALAGGSLDVRDFTDLRSGPIPGTVAIDTAPIRWDERCLPPPHRLNDHLDPVPNPLGADFLTVADAAAVTRSAMERWNRVPTAYAELELAGTTTNPGVAGFDFVNEITFRAPASLDFIASSPSIALVVDITLPAGLDVDGDGDSDVEAGLARCADTDGDGDVEIPAGFYPAGTILDNDVIYNTRPADGYRFTASDTAADTDVRSVDLEAVAVHELGHSLGLAHVLHNQESAGDGSAASMYRTIDTGDPVAELQHRTLDSDDEAYLSLLYPEGSAASGPAALAPGDVAFGEVYGLLEGEVRRHGLPVAGASVTARHWVDGERVASAYSGRVQLLLDAVTGELVYLDPAFHVLHGRFRIPVPQGVYRLEMEAVDGEPTRADRVNGLTSTGARLGQHDFPEEAWNGPGESELERHPQDARAVPVQPGRTRGGHRFETERSELDAPFGGLETSGFDDVGGGFRYAVRFPGAEVAARLEAGDLAVSGLLFTRVEDGSAVPRFASAALVPGRRLADGRARLHLDRPLRRAAPFAGQDLDFTPFALERPQELARRILRGLRRGDFEDLFLVLTVPPGPYPGPNGIPPLVGFDRAGDPDPARGRSYTSAGGPLFEPETRFDFLFALAFTPAPPP